jgi:RHH-type proline utilization regulon transcriptional repressor/proline dehydrogenase/delta 1-pyrroline-5-carboxylate dehydrogenase
MSTAPSPRRSHGPPPPRPRRALRRAADLYEAHAPEIFALLAREAGKTPPMPWPNCARPSISCATTPPARRSLTHPPRRLHLHQPVELPARHLHRPDRRRAGRRQRGARQTGGGRRRSSPRAPRRCCTRRASRARRCSFCRGRPEIGAALTSDPRIDGVAFTGSTATAQAIHRAMAANLAPDATLIAETGGLNAMIVDSTALPEQAVRDIIASAFQSAGQRCSALRCLYVQEDIAESFLKMLFGAMDELRLGDPWDLRAPISAR